MRVVRVPWIRHIRLQLVIYLLEWFVRAVATFSATVNEYSELKIYHRLGLRGLRLRFISIGSTSNDVVQIDVEEGQPRL